jgi:hypothetical protein
MANDTEPSVGMAPEEHRKEFPYDDRPVHPKVSDASPFESLSGRGQTEATPMGLGLGQS